MNKRNKRLTGASLVGVMTVASVVGATGTVEIKNVEAASNKDVQAVSAKVEHITCSLKSNYLGVKNVAQWQKYIKEARALNAKLPNGSSKDKYAERINKAESLVNAAARVNQVEKSMAVNAKVMRNVTQWDNYIELAKDDLAKVDIVGFKEQFSKLLERAALANDKIEEVKASGEKLQLLTKDGSKVSNLDYGYGVEISGNKTTLSDSTIKGDLKITGNNNNVVNVNVDGKLIVDPGENGVANITGVKAKEIVVLSGAEKSVYIDASVADKLTVSSSTSVRVKVTGKTEFKETKIASSSIFENVTGDLGKVVIGGDKNIVLKFKDDKKTQVVIINSVKIAEGSDTIENAIVDSLEKGISVEGNFVNLTVDKVGDKNIKISGNVEKVNVNTNADVKVGNGKVGKLTGKEGSTVNVEVGSGATVDNTTGTTNPAPPVSSGGYGNSGKDEKKELKAAMEAYKEEVKKYKEEDYTEESWTVFKKIVSDQNGEVNLGKWATVEKINAATVAVAEAAKNLAPSEAKLLADAKKAFSDEVNKYVEAEYTVESWTAFKEIVNAETEKVNAEGATIEIVNASTLAVTEAAKSLVTKAEADAQAKLLEDAKKAFNDEVNKYVEANYTTESWTAFTEIVNAETEKVNAADATIESVNASTLAVTEAAKSLAPSEAKLLEDAKKAFNDEVNKYVEAEYTTESWTAFAEVVATETAKVSAEDATIESVNASTLAVTEAASSLVTNVEAQAKLLADAKKAFSDEVAKYTEDKYTVDSWTAFNEVVTTETGKVNAEGATVEAINSSTLAVAEAAKSLALKDETPPEVPGDTEVPADTEAPTASIAGVSGADTNDADTLVITFTEDLYKADGSGLTSADNTRELFSLGGQTLGVTSITSAVYDANSKTITLTIADVDNADTIRVNDGALTDKAGNPYIVETITYALAGTLWSK